jgi:hypothetical protein
MVIGAGDLSSQACLHPIARKNRALWGPRRLRATILVWDWVWVWVALGWPKGGPSVAQGPCAGGARVKWRKWLCLQQNAEKGGGVGAQSASIAGTAVIARHRCSRKGKISPRRRGGAEARRRGDAERKVGLRQFRSFTPDFAARLIICCR